MDAINQEVSVLQQAEKRIGHWKDHLAADYQPLKLAKWRPRRIISEVERDRLFRVAAENSNWEAAYYFAVISVETTAGPKEIFTLRLQDVELGKRRFTVQPEGAKRDPRIRVLFLNDHALVAMTKAIGRASRLGATEDWHYIFPAMNKWTHKWNPAKHQTSFKCAWAKMIKAAELPGLKMYDLRRTAITDLLNDPDNAEETIRKGAGHVSRRMLDHYSVNRLDKMREMFYRLHAPRQPAETAEMAGTAETATDPSKKKPCQSVKGTKKKEAKKALIKIVASLLDDDEE